ncbi:MAG TPA: TraB/GumN family protein [Steroidobacter sp.]|nr:TraB/GumN family protein [Steroidobacter sp.]
MHRIARLAALILLSTSLPVVCGSAAESPAPARQPVWSVKGATNTLYLLGSVHFLNASEKLPAAADQAYADAEKVVMEIDLDDLSPIEMQQTTLELGMLPEGDSLRVRIGAETYAKVEARARELGLEPAVLNRFRPWFAALTLAQIQLIRMGLDPNSGVEQRVAARAAIDHKPIEGLETLREQLGMLAALPEKQQRQFLLYSVEDAEHAADEIDALLAAWRRGDAAALAEVLMEGFEQYPDLYRPLTVERNSRWLPILEQLLEKKDDYLVVVGALHLVGDNSVIELLEKHGYAVTQH